MNRYAYDENGWPRWILIGGAVLAIAALLAVGFIAGRTTAPTANGRSQVVNVQSGPGPTRVVNGVPVGYAHTQAGAVAAATNYLETFYGPLFTQPDRYRAAVGEMAAPDAATSLTHLAEEVISGSGQRNLISYAAQGHTVVNRFVPLSYRVLGYTDRRVQVSIWGETFVGADGVLPLRDGWTTTSVSCEWVNGDWKLSNIPASAGQDASFGPVPNPIQAPEQSTSLPSQLVNYRSYQANGT